MDNLRRADDMVEATNPQFPRVTLQGLLDTIASELYVRPGGAAWGHPAADTPLASTTLCVLTLKNGWIVFGKATPVHPGNFNAEIGRKLAKEDAVRQMWPLLGFNLRQKLHEEG